VSSYCTLDQVTAELPRIAKGGFDRETRPSAETVSGWISDASRWIDGKLGARGVATLPVNDAALLALLAPIATWLVAARVLLAADYEDIEDRAETLRDNARRRLAELPIAHMDAAEALLVAQRLAAAIPAAVRNEAKRRLAYYLGQSPPKTTGQSALRASGALELVRPWRQFRAGV